jgi:superfamily I DNA/RNA helicase
MLQAHTGRRIPGHQSHQMEILNLLVNNKNGNGTSFYVTGDDWQSIYAFTGA